MGTAPLNAKTFVSSIGVVKIIYLLFTTEPHTNLYWLVFSRICHLYGFNRLKLVFCSPHELNLRKKRSRVKLFVLSIYTTKVDAIQNLCCLFLCYQEDSVTK
jgi:hypothetical protein